MTDPQRPEVPAMTPADLEEYYRRQRARSRVMGLILGGLAILFFFITIAKLSD